MKWSFASVGLIILGLFGIIIILLFNDITVSNEQDYYTLKYATEASMLESVDVAYYRLTGEVKISQEKFVENFTRRFTETSTFGQGNYNIKFYQIIEYPAKVSLRIFDDTNSYNIYTYNNTVGSTQVNVVNELSAILDGFEIDIDHNGYTTENETGNGLVVGVDNNSCMNVEIAGRDKRNNNPVWKCTYPDKHWEFQDVSGNVVPSNQVYNPLTTNNEVETYTKRAYGTVKNSNVVVEEYTYTNTKDGTKRIEYKDASGKKYNKNQLDEFSKNYGKCTSQVVVGKSKTNKVNAMLCEWEDGQESGVEYQDIYGHKLTKSQINFLVGGNNECAEIQLAGTLADGTKVTACKLSNGNYQYYYADKNDKPVYVNESQIVNYTASFKCSNIEYVGVVKGTDTKIYKCTLKKGGSELIYKDGKKVSEGTEIDSETEE